MLAVLLDPFDPLITDVWSTVADSPRSLHQAIPDNAGSQRVHCATGSFSFIAHKRLSLLTAVKRWLAPTANAGMIKVWSATLPFVP